MALWAFHFALCVRLGASEVAVKASFVLEDPWAAIKWARVLLSLGFFQIHLL